MLSLEGQVVCEGAQPNFITGLAALFASFYNFSLQYQEWPDAFLTSIQNVDQKQSKEMNFEWDFVYIPFFRLFLCNLEEPFHLLKVSTLKVNTITALLMFY